MHADLFDEQPQEFLRLFGAFGGEDFVQLVGEAREGGRVRRRVRLCGEPAGKVGFLFAEGLEARTVATNALLAERGCEVAGFERLEVTLELALDSSDLSARGGELLLDPRPLLGNVRRRLGERLLDQLAVAVELGELGEDGCFEPVLRQPLATALAGAVLVAGRAGVVGVAVAAAVGGGAD